MPVRSDTLTLLNILSSIGKSASSFFLAQEIDAALVMLITNIPASIVYRSGQHSGRGSQRDEMRKSARRDTEVSAKVNAVVMTGGKRRKA
jgi:hypothetical protein